MKKLFLILVLCLVWGGSAFSQNSFNLSCRGIHKTTNDFNRKSEEIFIEDLKIEISDKVYSSKILSVEIIYSSHPMGRRTFFLEHIELKNLKDSFSISYRNEKAFDDYEIKSLNAYFSLISGSYSGTIESVWNGNENTYMNGFQNARV